VNVCTDLKIITGLVGSPFIVHPAVHNSMLTSATSLLYGRSLFKLHYSRRMSRWLWIRRLLRKSSLIPVTQQRARKHIFMLRKFGTQLPTAHALRNTLPIILVTGMLHVLIITSLTSVWTINECHWIYAGARACSKLRYTVPSTGETLALSSEGRTSVEKRNRMEITHFPNAFFAILCNSLSLIFIYCISECSILLPPVRKRKD